jgi:hypothetical protein
MATNFDSNFLGIRRKQQGGKIWLEK